MASLLSKLSGTPKPSPIEPTAVPNMRIINPDKLESFKRNVNDFVVAVSQNENWLDEGRINRLLIQYKLRSNDIIENYTLPYRNS